MNASLENMLRKNDKKYIRILRLLHLIEGVNESIDANEKMKNQLMIRQYQHLKKEYALELLKLLEKYRIPIHYID